MFATSYSSTKYCAFLEISAISALHVLKLTGLIIIFIDSLALPERRPNATDNRESSELENEMNVVLLRHPEYMFLEREAPPFYSV